MKQKLKKIFENAVWWSGVITVGIVLGVSLQIVKAWTEPTTAPPGGNVGAPINTSDVPQSKWGALQVLGFTLFNDSDLNDDGIIDNNVTGKVLTAQNANGAAAWAAGGGGGTYEVWGTTDCGSGTQIYTGNAMALVHSTGTISNLICSATSLKYSASYGWISGAHSDNSKDVSCALCRF